MRGLGLALLLLCGCPPDLDGFRVIGTPGVDAGPNADAGPGVDAGPARDAGGRDGGPPSGALLASSDCDALVSSTVIDEDFLDDMTDYRGLSGMFRVEGGRIVLVGPESFALLESIGSYRDVLACATVRVGRTTASHQLGVGLRGPMHGVNVVLMAHEARVRLFSLEPSGNVVVGEQPFSSWPSGQRDFTMLVYLSGTRVHAEVKDLTTGEVVVVRGTYGGAGDAVNSTFEGSPLVEDVSVDRVVVGPPTSAAAAILNGS